MREANKNLEKNIIEKKRYEMVKDTLKSGGESSRCELVSREVSVVDFILDFKEKLFYKYARHMGIGLSGWISNSRCVRTLS